MREELYRDLIIELTRPAEGDSALPAPSSAETSDAVGRYRVPGGRVATILPPPKMGLAIRGQIRHLVSLRGWSLANFSDDPHPGRSTALPAPSDLDPNRRFWSGSSVGRLDLPDR